MRNASPGASPRRRPGRRDSYQPLGAAVSVPCVIALPAALSTYHGLPNEFEPSPVVWPAPVSLMQV